MKAIRVTQFGDPEVLQLTEVPDPVPGSGQVVVQIKAAGINPVDTYIRSGAYGERPLPYTPGSDGAGTVESVGEGVSGIQPGDRVYTAGSLSGTYAEKALCDASQIHPLPSNISFSQGAGVFVPFATAHYALYHRAKGLPGESVLVHGATGGVGTAAVQIAHAGGFVVFGTGGTERGRELVAEQGADFVLDHHADGYLDEAVALNGGKGFDVILEMLANVNLERDLEHLADNGRVAVIGNRGTVEIDPRQAMRRDASILGVLLMNADEKTAAGIHAALFAGLSNGALKPIVGRELPLSAAAQGHADVMAAGAYGKIVLIP